MSTNFSKTFFFALSIFAALVGYSKASILGFDDRVSHVADELDDSVRNAENSITSILDKSDAIAKQRIDQIGKIVSDTFIKIDQYVDPTEGDVIKLLEAAKIKVEAVESKFFEDLNKILSDTVCEGDLFINSKLQDTLGGVGSVFSLYEFTLHPPTEYAEKILEDRWWFQNFFSDPPNKFNVEDIRQPGETFLDVEEYVLDALSNLQDHEPFYKVSSGYHILAATAGRAACFAKDSGHQVLFFRKMSEYKIKINNLHDTVKMELRR